MFARRRAFYLASRLPAVRAQPIAPFARYSTEAAATSPAPQSATPPPVNVDSTPPNPEPAFSDSTNLSDAEVPSSKSESPRPSFARSTPQKPTLARKPFVKVASKPYTSKATIESKPAADSNPIPPPAKPSTPATVTLTSGRKGLKFVHTPLIIPSAVTELGPVNPTQPPSIQWDTSHYGISSRPVTREQFETLTRPVPLEDIEVKPDGVLYLPEIKYRRRLNEVFGPMGWGLIPRGEPVVGDSIVTREYALIADNRFVSQAQGENNYFGADQLPSAVEGCKSNALMRCCKDLGIASELWDPVFLRWFRKNWMKEVWVEHMTTKKKRTLWYRSDDVSVAYPYKEVKK